MCWEKKLNKLETVIFLLQETHSTKATENTWKSQCGNQNIKSSHRSSNSRGAAILFSCELDIKIEQEITDINIRHILLDIECGSYNFTMLKTSKVNICISESLQGFARI